MKLARLVAVAALAALAGCAPVQTRSYDDFLAQQPRSILVVPIVNHTNNVDAADYFLSTLAIPVAERGYYVFPVNMVKRVLEDDGLSDADLVHQADPAKLAELFGADAVLYVTIERWDTRYLILRSSTTVEFSYVMKRRDGSEIWGTKQTMVYQSQGGNSLLAAVVSAAIQKAAPNYMPLAHQANGLALGYPGNGFPAGPYRPEYQKDVKQQ